MPTDQTEPRPERRADEQAQAPLLLTRDTLADLGPADGAAGDARGGAAIITIDGCVTWSCTLVTKRLGAW